MREAVNRADAPRAEQGWLDWLTEHGIPAITGVDTRALVRHIRDAGAMRGGVFPARDRRARGARARRRRAADGRPGPRPHGHAVRARRSSATATVRDRRDRHRHQVLDRPPPRRSAARRVELHPCDVRAQDLLDSDPDAVFMANGPGDPAALDYVVATLRELVGKKPVWGICLGHQLLSRAVGLETFKLPFGHRGVNHPVKDVETGRIEITSQNHGFAVVGPGGAHTISRRRAGPLRDRLRRRPAQPREPLRPHGRGPDAARRARRARSSTTPRQGPARTTPTTCSTSSSGASPVPRRDDIHRILILGSGPIVIGQAAEFDYSGVQACKVLKEEGYEVVLVNSNPATIMTDPEFADATYVEPLLPGPVAQIIEKERPDALLPTLGGQTALNLARSLHEDGTLEQFGVELIGANYDAIGRAEDRDLFRQTMEAAGPADAAQRDRQLDRRGAWPRSTTSACR